MTDELVKFLLRKIVCVFAWMNKTTNLRMSNSQPENLRDWTKIKSLGSHLRDGVSPQEVPSNFAHLNPRSQPCSRSMRQTQLIPVFISLIKTILNYRSYTSTKLISTRFTHPLLSSEPPKHVAFSRSSGRSAISFYDDLCTDALLRQQQRCKHRHTLQTHFNLINITDDDYIYIYMDADTLL